MAARTKHKQTPAEGAITHALVTWLESAIIGTTAEDMEVVAGNDPGEPADPYLAVFVSVASGKLDSPTQRFEVTLAIMAEDSTWLPDDAEEILDDVHTVLSQPVDTRDAYSKGGKPFDALLFELRDMAEDGSIPKFFTIQEISEAVEPRLETHAADFEHRIYTGTVKL
jgi:hypothetical protein